MPGKAPFLLRRRALAGLAAGLLCASLARADLGTEQTTLAAQGRFDELERLMEAQPAPLLTPDQHALCFAYSKTKRYNRLFPCLEQLDKAIAKGPRHTRIWGLDDATPTVPLMRATAAIELGQYAEAVEQARKAAQWVERERSDDRDIEIEALAIFSIASSLAGKREDGARYAEKLAKVSVSWPMDSDYAGIKAMALARAWSALGQYDRALAALRADKSFALRTFLDNLVSGASLRGTSNWLWAELPRGFLVSRALLETGQVAEAKSGFDQLLAIPATAANGDIYWLILFDRGRIAEREGKLEEAIQFYRKAIEVIEEQRTTINTEAAKIGFIGDKQAAYGHAVAAMLTLRQNELAYEYVERSKARALVDLLAAKEDFSAPHHADKARALIGEWREADRAARVQTARDMTRGGESRGNSKVDQVRAQLAAISPELLSLISVSAMTARDVQQRLGNDEAVLEYYAYENELYALTVSRAGVKAVKLDSTGLEAAVKKFRKELQGEGKDVETQAKALYDRLVRPVEGMVEARNLLVIPHGVLHYVAFPALHDGRDHWVASRNLRFLPSASVVRFLKPGHSKLSSDALVIGNPDTGGLAQPLPSAETEARAISAMLPGSLLLTRAQATETEFKRLAPTRRVLHVASHGEFVGDNALASRLLLTRDAANDGSLTTSELYALRLDADLVTLSACETGLGAILGGDDVVGLTRGFLYAGASNIVASLWEVDDEATKLLMQSFYGSLKNGVSKRDALRVAQLEVRRLKPHPFYWGAFFLTGNGI